MSGLSVRSSFTYSSCPGGPAIITCGGDGTYTYTHSGNRFHMEIAYSGCRCGGVRVNILTRDVFDGSFDGASTLSGTVGCSFEFRR